LQDPQVKDILRRCHGIQLEAKKAGSLEMAQLPLEGIDFLWPSSEVPVSYIEEKYGPGVKKSAAVGYSPMIVATWEPVFRILEKNGLIKVKQDMYILDLRRFLPLTLEQKNGKNSPEGRSYIQ